MFEERDARQSPLAPWGSKAMELLGKLTLPQPVRPREKKGSWTICGGVGHGGGVPVGLGGDGALSRSVDISRGQGAAGGCSGLETKHARRGACAEMVRSSRSFPSIIARMHDRGLRAISLSAAPIPKLRPDDPPTRSGWLVPRLPVDQ
jgi:hypothetical protein